MNRTGKKAEKMLKSFKAEKNKTAKESKLDSSVSDKIAKRVGGIELVGAGDPYTAYDEMAANIEALVDADLNRVQLFEALSKVPDNDNTYWTAAAVVEEFAKYGIKYDGKGMSGMTLAKIFPKVLTAHYDKRKMKLDGITADMAGVSDKEFSDSMVFPLYAKGELVYCSVVYIPDSARETKSDDAEAVAVARADHKLFSVSVSDLGDDKSKEVTVLSTTDIEKSLESMKTSSKKLKAFSDKRLKDMDKVMKVINEASKTSAGIPTVRRFKATASNKLRTMVASTFISSIFAMASCESLCTKCDHALRAWSHYCYQCHGFGFHESTSIIQENARHVKRNL